MSEPVMYACPVCGPTSVLWAGRAAAPVAYGGETFNVVSRLCDGCRDKEPSSSKCGHSHCPNRDGVCWRDVGRVNVPAHPGAKGP
ncbi:hypothetical protein LCGC14_2443180 [marine sediment metagenome]|uniref:Uncharacterized protein n=1 Tax=marine sediment metagenome TaxID=412755 RepID=A0A0F9DVE4_9ZZZZ